MRLDREGNDLSLDPRPACICRRFGRYGRCWAREGLGWSSTLPLSKGLFINSYLIEVKQIKLGDERVIIDFASLITLLPSQYLPYILSYKFSRLQVHFPTQSPHARTLLQKLLLVSFYGEIRYLSAETQFGLVNVLGSETLRFQIVILLLFINQWNYGLSSVSVFYCLQV